jgi:hypothetical protein
MGYARTAVVVLERSFVPISRSRVWKTLATARVSDSRHRGFEAGGIPLWTNFGYTSYESLLHIVFIVVVVVDIDIDIVSSSSSVIVA